MSSNKRSSEEAQLDASPVEAKKRFVRDKDAFTLLAHVALVDLPVARKQEPMPEVLFDLIMEYCAPSALRRLADEADPELYVGGQPTRDYLDALAQVFHSFARVRVPDGPEWLQVPRRTARREDFPGDVSDGQWGEIARHCLPTWRGPRHEIDLDGYLCYAMYEPHEDWHMRSLRATNDDFLRTHADRLEPASK
ncbi:MAG: hypothetical protein Q7V62_08190 [Actinomycetota bacterium]|nr:hypothetical protein [Actinomycetota bacterium]